MLTFVRVVHTAVWAFFVALILALPILAFRRRFDWACVDIGLVLLEGLVLAVNGGSCPLTRVAARYTDDRRANFDIYLPLWLAEHNKLVFTALFLAGVVAVVGRWLAT